MIISLFEADEPIDVYITGSVMHGQFDATCMVTFSDEKCCQCPLLVLSSHSTGMSGLSGPKWLTKYQESIGLLYSNFKQHRYHYGKLPHNHSCSLIKSYCSAELLQI